MISLKIPYLLIPIFLSLVVIEALWLKRSRKVAYDWRASAASLVIGLGQNISGLLTAGVFAGVYLWAWQHHLYNIPLKKAWAIALLFLGVEFLYYWQHRISHGCRWFWASHAVHHSSTQFNLSASYRLGWTVGISGVLLIYLPLVWIGFPPPAVFAMLGLNLAYQFWLHTELVPKLGWFEWAFNTPSHHRVHHGTNVDYLDRNYGGVLIVFDRLFGTYATETEPSRYGLVKPLVSHNPVYIAFHEWLHLWQDVHKARRWRDGFGIVFGPPGWRPNGEQLTTKAMRLSQEREREKNSCIPISKEN